MNIVFDMDGVLIDVRHSYHEVICRSVEFFCGQRPPMEEVYELKRKGGFNSDWKLTEELIRRRNGRVEFCEIVQVFQQFYLGQNFSGLINEEQALISSKFLARLSSEHVLGIMTGRPLKEAEFSLSRFALRRYFNVMITSDDYPKDRGKPHADGLKMVCDRLPHQPGMYIGDIPDDVRAARAAGMTAGVFIGPGSFWCEKDFTDVFPDFILTDWKQLEEAIC